MLHASLRKIKVALEISGSLVEKNEFKRELYGFAASQALEWIEKNHPELTAKSQKGREVT